MARVELAPEVGDDVDRILDHLFDHEGAEISARIEEILQAVAVLEYNPLVGRSARDETHELVIGRRSPGYVALYRYVPEIDTVFILASRSHKEAGYNRS